MKAIKFFISLTLILIFISFVNSDSIKILNELKSVIDESESLVKPYYVSNVPELNAYWNSFYSTQNKAKTIYDNAYNLLESGIELDIDEELDLELELIFQKEDLEKKINLIKDLNDLEKAFTDRLASKNSNKGFEITINDQSITTNGANRLRAEYDRESSAVYLLMSKYLQSQSFLKGTSGLGLKTALMNVMSSEYCYQVKSGDKVINLYSNGIKKSESQIRDEAEILALSWIKTGNYGGLSGESRDFTIIGRIYVDGNISNNVSSFERTFYFNFIDAEIQNFETGYSYCYLNSKTVKCNKVEYYDSNNNLIKLEKVEYNKSAKPFYPEEIEGQIFEKWNTSLDNIISDIITFPEYEKIKYNVTFKDYNGTILDIQEIPYGEDATSPEQPTRKGYNFLRWDIDFNNVKKNLNVSATYEEIVFEYSINNSSEGISINIDENVSSSKINLSALINSSGQGEIPEINITASNANDIIVNIPATNITSSNLSWNGIMKAPTIVSISIPKKEGKSRSQSIAIKIGFDEGRLDFSNAVRLFFPNEAGKKVAYFSEGKFNEINTLCGGDNQTWVDINLGGVFGECYIYDNNDLVIWTKHFTEFVTYTEVDLPKTESGTSGSSSSGSVSSSKGTNSLSSKCSSFWVCSDWPDCANNVQKRSCQDSNNCLIPDTKKPIETRECNLYFEEDIINLNSPTRAGLGLGAVIGFNKETYGIIFLGLFIFFSLSIILYLMKFKTFK